MNFTDGIDIQSVNDSRLFYNCWFNIQTTRAFYCVFARRFGFYFFYNKSEGLTIFCIWNSNFELQTLLNSEIIGNLFFCDSWKLFVEFVQPELSFIGETRLNYKVIHAILWAAAACRSAGTAGSPLQGIGNQYSL